MAISDVASSRERARQPMFKGRHFDQEIIILCVRWYVTYKLSYRDLAAMMLERGVAVAPSTIFGWVQRYVPEFEKRWDRFSRPGRLFLAR
jgi:transposase-like protein